MLKTIVQPLLEQLLKYIDNNNYWVATAIIAGIFLLISGFGFGLAWLLQRKKLQREIEKIGLESKEKATSLLKTLQQKRNSYLDETILIQLSVRACIDSLTKRDKNNLQINREELIDLFFNDLVKNFIEYIEISEIFFSGWNKKIVASIEDEVIPFLQTIQAFQATVNNPSILEILDAEESTLKAFTVKPIFRYMSNNRKFYQVILRYKCFREIRKIKLSNAT